MANSVLYQVCEALRATIAAQFNAAKTALSLSVTNPAAYLLIAADYPRERHSNWPTLFVIPFPDQQSTTVEHQTTRQRGEWHVPLAIELVFSERAGLEADVIKAILDYAQIIDRVLLTNQTLGRSDTLLVASQSFHPAREESAQGTLWGVSTRVTARVNVEYN